MEQQRRRPRFEQVPLHAVPAIAADIKARTVLVVGRHGTLLQSRTAVLEAAGFRAVAAGALASAVQALATEPVDTVVMCHTLSQADRETLVQVVRERRPSVQVIRLFTLYPHPEDGVDVMIDSHEGPGELIQAILKRGK